MKQKPRLLDLRKHIGQVQELRARLQTNKGSILVYTLIVMMIMLATALSIFAVAVREKKSAGTTAASMQAFAVADSGSEVALNAIFKNPDATIEAIYSCTDGIATIPDLVGGSVQLTFYSDEESANIIPCTGKLGDARKVKSVGRYGGTARAVEVAVAQTGSCSWFPVGKDCGSYGCLPDQVLFNGTYLNYFNATSSEVCNIKNSGSWAAGWTSAVKSAGSGSSWLGDSWSMPFSCAPIGCLNYVYCCQ